MPLQPPNVDVTLVNQGYGLVKHTRAAWVCASAFFVALIHTD